LPLEALAVMLYILIHILGTERPSYFNSCLEVFGGIRSFGDVVRMQGSC
jgi:hypothetical protein